MTRIIEGVIDVSDYLNDNWLRVKDWTLPPFGTQQFKDEISDAALPKFKETRSYMSAFYVLKQIVEDGSGNLAWDFDWAVKLLTMHYPNITLDKFPAAVERLLRSYASGTMSYYVFKEGDVPQVIK